MKSSKYRQFEQINGTHDFRNAVPGGFVEYEARAKRGGRVAYFNFVLAREMGLIPAQHNGTLDAELENAILDTFSIQIINEYDILHRSRIPHKDRLNRKYMATRYLQLQHTSRTGKTSGDGRSIWNGQLRAKGTTWDITSCGTGATCLSPAAATLGFTPRTGDPHVSYGCGKADINEGIAAALQSEVFHKNGIATERSLAIIAFENGSSINVRAGKCLLRPSHFFNHLKQGNREALKNSIDYFINRQMQNGTFRPKGHVSKRYFELAAHVAEVFARMAATFESEYIFVWMDWDGDNILADGGIIDYGSVRQFGLYHRAYRFDDGDRWSTTIPEQKSRARGMVQGFIQIADFLSTGKKQNLKCFRKHPLLKKFDKEFEHKLLQLFLRKNGFSEFHQDYLLKKQLKKVRELHSHFSYFEKASRSRSHRVPDGITRDAVYCMRDLLRELPSLLKHGKMKVEDRHTPSQFLELIASAYAQKKDRIATPTLRSRVKTFLRCHREFLAHLAEVTELSFQKICSQMEVRATYLNPRNRITGESVLHLTDHLVSERKKGLRPHSLQCLMEDLVKCHVYAADAPAFRRTIKTKTKRRRIDRVLLKGLNLIEEDRETL